jgi:phosphoribosylformimino-5-aminoimidazole carboxamide ribotide isomerase
VVDLDGAFAGKPKNERAIKRSCRRSATIFPVQLGGGIRDLDTIERCLDDGVSYVIIGTAAVKNPGFLHDACGAFPGHIIVGLDARDGKVAVDGWSKMTGHDVIDLAENTRTTASRPSSIPTSAATACSRGSTSRPR